MARRADGPADGAIVIMRPTVRDDGSLSLLSAGQGFGHPGFYFTLKQRDGNLSARYVNSLRESIHVYPSGQDGGVRADHVLTLWGRTFLELHYRLRR